jgi:hypothetical protein
MDQTGYELTQITAMTVESILDQIRVLHDVPLDQIRARIRGLGAGLQSHPMNKSHQCAESSIRVSYRLNSPNRDSNNVRAKRHCPELGCNGKWSRLVWFSKHFREKHSQNYIQSSRVNQFFWVCPCGTRYPTEVDFVEHMWEAHMRS